mmetsp:Transcript_107227/g.201860  ORF Transcript_107227/g.201860 Transcript_107227/m.201860 type:complete len:213 (-) Transcript_107227:32-670(-)
MCMAIFVAAWLAFVFDGVKGFRVSHQAQGSAHGKRGIQHRVDSPENLYPLFAVRHLDTDEDMEAANSSKALAMLLLADGARAGWLPGVAAPPGAMSRSGLHGVTMRAKGPLRFVRRLWRDYNNSEPAQSLASQPRMPAPPPADIGALATSRAASSEALTEAAWEEAFGDLPQDVLEAIQARLEDETLGEKDDLDLDPAGAAAKWWISLESRQ